MIVASSVQRRALTSNSSRGRSQHVRCPVVYAAAADAAEIPDDNAVVYAEGGDEESAPPQAEPAAEPQSEAPGLPSYVLNILWMDRAIGVAVDQYLASGEKGPVTEYFMWPANDAWDQLKTSLETMPWISQVEMIHLLNDATEVINFWQDDSTKHTMDEAAEKFKHIAFYGS